MDEKQRSEGDNFGLVSLFNRISTFVGYLIPKPPLEKNSHDTIYPSNWGG